MQYPFLEVKNIKGIIGDKVLVEWETAKKDLLEGKLVRPDTQVERYYTGIIIKKGFDVGAEELQEGARIFFEQFSNFEKFQSNDGKKRYAIVREDAILAVIPHRINLKCEDWSVYGEGEN